MPALKVAKPKFSNEADDQVQETKRVTSESEEGQASDNDRDIEVKKGGISYSCLDTHVLDQRLCISINLQLSSPVRILCSVPSTLSPTRVEHVTARRAYSMSLCIFRTLSQNSRWLAENIGCYPSSASVHSS